MDPIILSVRVHLAREEASALLDELANHVVDWSFDGPAAAGDMRFQLEHLQAPRSERLAAAGVHAHTVAHG